MSDDFDQRAAWRELERSWNFGKKPRKSLKNAQEAFESAVHDTTRFTAVLEAARAAMEMHSNNPQASKVWLTDIIRNTEAPEVEVPAPVPVMVQAPLPTVRPAWATIFDEVWSSWPRSGDFLEVEENAKSAFRETVKKHGLEPVVTACRYYIACALDPLSGAKPCSLRWFLQQCPEGDDIPWWRHYHHRATTGPSPEERAEFRAVLAWYPRQLTEHEARDAIGLWRRHVPEGQRFDFLLAVRAYRASRRRQDQQFTLGFARFLADWRGLREARYDYEVCDLLRPLAAELRAIGIEPQAVWNEREDDALRALVLQGRDAATAAKDYVLRTAEGWTFLTGAPTMVAEEAAAMAGRVVAATYRKACESEPVVVLSDVGAGGGEERTDTRDADEAAAAEDLEGDED